MARSNEKVIKLVRLLYNGGEYLAIDSVWLAKYLSKALGEVHHCYVMKIVKRVRL